MCLTWILDELRCWLEGRLRVSEVSSVRHLGQRLAEGVHVVQGVEELVGVGQGDPAPAHHQPEQPAREGVEAIHGLNGLQ